MQTFNYTRHQNDEILIGFITGRFPYLPKSDWITAINTGALRVNGELVTPDYVLMNRDVISYDRPRSSEPEIDRTYNIIYIDDAILVVDKNGNIPIAESGKYYRNTLINVLKEEEGFEQLFAVHRLDKETSGTIVIARKKEIATILGKQFARQETKKEYHAILRGDMVRPEIIVDKAIKKNIPIPGRVRIRQIVSPTGKSSKSLFIRERASHGLTLARVKLYTGRTHQIRCHAEYIGYPILGDKLYGNSDRNFIQLLKEEIQPEFPPWGIIQRQLLHASYLTFKHPVTGQEMRFTTDYRSAFSQYKSILGDLIT